MKPAHALPAAAVVGVVAGCLAAFLLGIGVEEGQCLVTGTGAATCEGPRPSLGTFLVGGGLGAAVALAVAGFLLLVRSSRHRV